MNPREIIGKFDQFIAERWLNNGPESLRTNLPDGWGQRVKLIFSGRAITLHALGRPDFLKAKLFVIENKIGQIVCCSNPLRTNCVKPFYG